MRYSGFLVLCTSGLVLLAGSASSLAATDNAAGSSPTKVHVGRFTEEFAGSVPANPAQARVIDGFREAEVLWDKSEVASSLVPPVTQFVIGVALSHLNRALAFDKQQGLIIGGTDEFFMTRVSRVSANSATVTTCDNGSKVTGVYVATGKVDSAMNAPADQAYMFETWNMARHSGHWAISSFTLTSLPSARAKPCQP
jgi:hypothetical protein